MNSQTFSIYHIYSYNERHFKTIFPLQKQGIFHYTRHANTCVSISMNTHKIYSNKIITIGSRSIDFYRPRVILYHFSM